jgi:hypothetical protein
MQHQLSLLNTPNFFSTRTVCAAENCCGWFNNSLTHSLTYSQMTDTSSTSTAAPQLDCPLAGSGTATLLSTSHLPLSLLSLSLSMSFYGPPPLNRVTRCLSPLEVFHRSMWGGGGGMDTTMLIAPSSRLAAFQNRNLEPSCSKLKSQNLISSTPSLKYKL